MVLAAPTPKATAPDRMTHERYMHFPRLVVLQHALLLHLIPYIARPAS
jgi:hypothetical protein